MKDLKLGDKVEKIIETVTPKAILEAVKRSDCGCQKRKDWLNGLTSDEIRKLAKEKNG